MIADGTYGLRDLPRCVRAYVVEKSTQQAGWISPQEKGEDGSTTAMEWITFALTPKRWIADIEAILGLPDELRQELMNL